LLQRASRLKKTISLLRSDTVSISQWLAEMLNGDAEAKCIKNMKNPVNAPEPGPV
jgi:hypothetical protein